MGAQGMTPGDLPLLLCGIFAGAAITLALVLGIALSRIHALTDLLAELTRKDEDLDAQRQELSTT